MMFELDIAGRPFVDKAGDMAMALPPGLAFKIRDLLRQPIADLADIDRHGNAGG
nr:hypothetical protein [Rhizobium leguminosarum]